MIAQKSHIQMLNLLPSNKAAAEVLRRMGITPAAGQMHMLQLAEAKGAEELAPANDPMQDLSDLNRLLTEPAARKIASEMSDDPDWLEEQDAEDLIMAIMSETPLNLFNPRMLQ